jgi:putative tryptophan/tyrosine transport system substrate-binding protein
VKAPQADQEIQPFPRISQLRYHSPDYELSQLTKPLGRTEIQFYVPILSLEDCSMRRREFIAGLGGVAVAWPLAARAQQRTKPIIGMLDGLRVAPFPREETEAFYRGLAEVGFLQGDITFDYRTTGGHDERVPALVADLVRQRPAAIFVLNGPLVVALKAATREIPIVFTAGFDPVELGLVASLNHPGGNVTGIFNLSTGLAEKRLQLLHEAVPTTETIALLVGPDVPYNQIETRHAQSAARTLGLRLLVFNLTDKVPQFRDVVPSDLFPSVAAAFTTLVEQRAGAVLLGSSQEVLYRTDAILSHAARFALPTMCFFSVQARAGGLLSYSPDFNGMGRQVGIYTGRILKGEKPGDLPVIRPTKFEFLINLKTAKALGLTIPPNLLALADEVIE